MFNKLLKWGGIVLIVSGVTLIVLMLTGNEKAEYIVNTSKDKVEYEFNKGAAIVSSVVTGSEESSTEYIPEIYWGGSGGMYELDTADWREFIELDAYKDIPENPPILGAHSTLGGSFIIPWGEGQKFRIIGGPYDGEWVVVHPLDIDKFGKVDQALKLQGDIGLQTCHWGVPVVRLVGAVPSDKYDEGYRGTLSDSEGAVGGGSIPS